MKFPHKGIATLRRDFRQDERSRNFSAKRDTRRLLGAQRAPIVARMSDPSTPPARLKAARIDAGWKSAAKFAADVGVDDATYRSHEMTPGAPSARAFGEDHAQLYAEALDVNWMWLLYGEDVAPRRGDASPVPVSSITESQAAAALRPLLGAMVIDEGAAKSLARGLLKAIRAAQALETAQLKDTHYEIAGAMAAQETARDWQKAS